MGSTHVQLKKHMIAKLFCWWSKYHYLCNINFITMQTLKLIGLPTCKK